MKMSMLVKKIIDTNKYALNSIFKTGGRIYTFLNPVSYLAALDNKSLFARFDGLFADGAVLVSAIKTMYGDSVIRRSFDMTSMAPELFAFAVRNRKKIYVVASRQEQVEKAIAIFSERYRGIVFAGYRNGYFLSDKEMDETAKQIAKAAPDFLIVGMGALVQERFLLKVKEAGFKGIGFTCGGFIHQTSQDRIDYYPEWVDRLNVRFLYRMYQEKHTRKRYMQAAFLFPTRFMAERFFGRKEESS